MEEGGLVTESAQILMPLTEVMPYMAKKKLSPEGTRFFYHYLVFRALLLSFFGSYMYQERKLRDSIYKGVMKSRPMTRLIRTAKAIHFMDDDDFIMNQRLYLKINMFMRQWAIFDPKKKEHYYRYYPNFTTYIVSRMDDEAFEDRINSLLDEFCRADRFTLSERDRNFLLQETAAYINTVSHAMYFAYKISSIPGGMSGQRIPCSKDSKRFSACEGLTSYGQAPMGLEGSSAFRHGRDRDGAFLYSRRGLHLRRRGAYSPVLTHGLRVTSLRSRGS